MKIGIACGGTGGHIFPGLATAFALRHRGHDMVLWLAGKDVEKTALHGWSGQVETVPARGFSSGLSLRSVSAVWRMVLAVHACRKSMKSHQIDVLLAMGSYASIGPALAAKQLGIPLVLHEANVIPGRATRFLQRWAEAVAIGFEETREILHHACIKHTGIPLRKFNLNRHYDPGSQVNANSAPNTWSALDSNCFTVLIMGGSRGAHTLNIIAADALIRLYGQGGNIQVIHLTGSADESLIRKKYKQACMPHLVFGFLNAMGEAYKRVTLTVCRSGASTCAELSHYGVPALLVPYPFATHQHQLANARALERSGSAHVIEESDLTVERLTDYISAHMADPMQLENMKKAAKSRDTGDAASLLADLVEEVSEYGSKSQ